MPRRITADYIFPVSSPPVRNGVVEVGEDGKILSITKESGGSETAYFPGVICPGFINAHCHLELSHLRGVISRNHKLPGFIRELLPLRNRFSDGEKRAAMEAAEKEMYDNGIAGIGDISNESSTFSLKCRSAMHFHTFMEVFDIASETDAAFGQGIKLIEELKKEFEKKGRTPAFSASITPHAPYTVSQKLMKKIAEAAADEGRLLSIHNQETRSEDELFRNGKGELADLFRQMGFAGGYKTGKSSLRSTFPFFKDCPKILLVHNTFAGEEDFKWASGFANSWWCFCPKANLYIENSLPDFGMFAEADARCVIGTDSLASNDTLSVLEEMKVITRNSPQVPFEKILQWGTLNGARLFGWENELGSIETGKRPGLVRIIGFDREGMKLTPESRAERVA